MTGRRFLIIGVTAALILAMAVAVVFIAGGNSDKLSSASLSRQDYPVRGIDISAHNGDIDFDRVKADSIDFVFIKATEGSSFKDRRFNDNFYRAKAAGLKVGVYHFFRFDATGYMQGLNFHHAIKDMPVDLPVAIDLEEWANPREWSTEAVIYRLNEFVAYLERHGYSTMIYTNKDGYERFVKGRFDSRPIWIATFTPPDQDIDWQMWQHSHRGSVDGIDGRVDLNIFNGTHKQWRQWLNKYSRQPQ